MKGTRKKIKKQISRDNETCKAATLAEDQPDNEHSARGAVSASTCKRIGRRTGQEFDNAGDTQVVMSAAVVEDMLPLKSKRKKRKTLTDVEETRVQASETAVEPTEQLATEQLQPRKLKRLKRCQHADAEALPNVAEMTEGIPSAIVETSVPEFRKKLKSQKKHDDNHNHLESDVASKTHAHTPEEDGDAAVNRLDCDNYPPKKGHDRDCNNITENGNAIAGTEKKRSKKKKQAMKGHEGDEVQLPEADCGSDVMRDSTRDILGERNTESFTCNGTARPEVSQVKKEKHRAKADTEIETPASSQASSNNDKTAAAVLRFAMQASSRSKSILKQEKGTENQAMVSSGHEAKQNTAKSSDEMLSKCDHEGNEKRKRDEPKSEDGHTPAGEPSKMNESSGISVVSTDTAVAKQDGEINQACRKVCAANLPKDLDVPAIWKHFEKCGPVEDVYLIRDWYSNASRGVCFVTFKSLEGAREALKLNDSDLTGKKVRVNLALDRQSGDKSKGRGKGHDAVSSKGYGKSYAKAPSKQALTNEACSYGGKNASKGKARNDSSDVTSLGDIPEGCAGLVVKQLSFAASEDDLRGFFSGCGDGPSRIRILKDKDGNSKGKAFVDFVDRKSVEMAGKLNGTKLKGRWIALEYAQPRSDT